MYASHNSLSDLLEAVKRAIDANHEHLSSFRVRCVAARIGDKWVSRVCVIQGFAHPIDAAARLIPRNYHSTLLCERDVVPIDLAGLLSNIANGQLEFGDQVVHFSQLGNWIEDRLDSQNYYCDPPARVLKAGGPGNVPFVEHSLISYDLDCYPTTSHAIRAWMGLARASLTSSSDSGSVILVIPEYRAAFQSFVYHGDKLVVSISVGGGARNLAVQATWVKQREIYHAKELVSKAGVTIPLPRDADEGYLWLLNEQGDVLDSYQEVSYLPIDRRRFLNKGLSADEQASISDDIDRGEGECIEFKPFIRIGNRKMEEVVETAIAFANTSGGKIIMGVDDYCRIIGVQRDVFEASKDEITVAEGGDRKKAAFDWYMGAIRSVLRSKIVPDLDIGISHIEVGGESLVIVEVQENKGEIYQHRENRPGVWVRHSANNVYPNRQDLLRMAKKTGRSPFDLIRPISYQ